MRFCTDSIVFVTPARLRLILAALVLGTSLQAAAGGMDSALVNAAIARTAHTVVYDGRYLRIAYPGGDVPQGIGVCTDVVIRSYRALGIDLQELVHEDMASHFERYPSRRIWGLKWPDPNIDHRRVPNLQVFFSRHGESLPVTDKVEDYRPGDIVTWLLPGNLPHIGIVTDRAASNSQRPLIVHNIGRGPRLDDMLFVYPVSGHYRYFPENEPVAARVREPLPGSSGCVFVIRRSAGDSDGQRRSPVF